MTEPLVETVELDVDESNELLFKVAIEGHVVGPAKVRLVCESDEMAYMFHGRPASDQPGLVQFILNKGLAAGTYPARIEVMVENRYFVPVNFNIEMKKAVSVVVESVQAVKIVKRDDVKVTASQIVVKPRVEAKPVMIEGPQRPQTKKGEQPSLPEVKGPKTPLRSGTLAQRYQQRSSKKS